MVDFRRKRKKRTIGGGGRETDGVKGPTISTPPKKGRFTKAKIAPQFQLLEVQFSFLFFFVIDSVLP
jgi:hypothetical protein